MTRRAPDSGGNSEPLVLSMGEPAGIGGEVMLKAWLRREELGAPFFAIDAPERLTDLSQDLGMDVPVIGIDTPDQTFSVFSKALPVLSMGRPIKAIPGKPTKDTAAAVLDSIETAVRLTLAGKAAGIVTNPIQKQILYKAGFSHPGHTEYLAALADIKSPPVMMLAGHNLRVVPVTIHVSLRQALDQLTTDAIIHAARVTYKALSRDFGIFEPRIAIAGLNPHAGEGGAMGDEEATIIQPAIAALADDGIQVAGPLPPDTMFSPDLRKTYDAAICMYHDQALIPIKALEFDQAVNVTLGLPFVRTSPDHGTALDIAGKGIANESSLISALNLAANMAERRRQLAE
jgi:4-hydroxythreonine-4-phosphate dehydrogenase